MPQDPTEIALSQAATTIAALWWFIENVGPASTHRTDMFFRARQLARTTQECLVERGSEPQQDYWELIHVGKTRGPWTITCDNHLLSFPSFAKKRDAMSVARSWRETWPGHTYKVIPDPDFVRIPKQKRG